MRKLLLFITMAAALLFTQCKKDDKNSMPSEGKTVRMTVTAGPGSKTDITDEGRITWSKDDKLYVGDGSKYIGYLTLKSGANSATGVFTGNVTLDGISEKTFHFFYLGSGDYTTGDNALQAGKSTSVEVDFSSQNIYKKDANNKKLENAGACHVGYGSATGSVVGNVVTDINVMMVSKVAIARFSFTKDSKPYTNQLTLSGTNICNKMTVNFSSDVFACTGTKGNISLTNETTSEKDETTSEKYVMLVPTSETTGSQALTFAGDGVSGKTTLANGIKPNQFYGLNGALEVSLKGPFSTSATTGVEFAPGNLYYNGASDASKMNSDLPSGWNFYENQWDCYPSGTKSATDEMEINLFTWGYGAWSTVYDTKLYETGNTMTDWGSLIGDYTANTWRTLSKDEWVYLMNTRTASTINGVANARYAEVKVNGVCGMMLFPDTFTWPAEVSTKPSTFNTYQSNWNGENCNYSIADFGKLESVGVVFLPAAGFRYGTDVHDVGSHGSYWSSAPSSDTDKAYHLDFNSGLADPQSSYGRYDGRSVRLVR